MFKGIWKENEERDEFVTELCNLSTRYVCGLTRDHSIPRTAGKGGISARELQGRKRTFYN